jgi:hypothetical protein
MSLFQVQNTTIGGDIVKEYTFPAWAAGMSTTVPIKLANDDAQAICIGPNSWIGDVRVIAQNLPNGVMVAAGAPYVGFLRGPIQLLPRFVTSAVIGYSLEILVYSCQPSFIPIKRAPLFRTIVQTTGGTITRVNPYDVTAGNQYQLLITGRKTVRVGYINNDLSNRVLNYRFLSYGWGSGNSTATDLSAPEASDTVVAGAQVMRQFLPSGLATTAFSCAGGDIIQLGGTAVDHEGVVNIEAHD